MALTTSSRSESSKIIPWAHTEYQLPGHLFPLGVSKIRQPQHTPDLRHGLPCRLVLPPLSLSYPNTGDSTLEIFSSQLLVYSSACATLVQVTIIPGLKEPSSSPHIYGAPSSLLSLLHLG